MKLAPKGRLIPALKSNAYGHGICTVADILESELKAGLIPRSAIPFFAIDSYFEAINLRAKGVKTPLLIIAYTRPDVMQDSCLKKISYVVSNIETLEDISRIYKKINIHLKIDTGMHRQGIFPSEIDRAVKIIKSNPNINLEGICSHFADADNADSTFTMEQIKLWNEVVSKFEKIFGNIPYIHLSNSYGHKYAKDIKANISRLGIGLYGLCNNLTDDMSLQPILSMKTILTGIKTINKGDTVGYSNTFTADREMKIANIPVGYSEGLDRQLSNIGFVQVGPNKTLCPIIGRISMNITTIDVSGLKDPKIGDEVIVISDDNGDKNSISGMIGALHNTIEYELLVHIPQHLKRVVV
jgi:alanine racemase